VQSWGQNYNEKRNTGVTDSNNKSNVKEYENEAQPYKPTRIVEKDGKATTYVYDERGNVTETTNPRGTKTRYWYDYSTFYFGRLIKSQIGTLTPTTYTYYEPSGLVKAVTSAKPGSTTGEAVTTSYTYDEIGNTITVTKPGNNAAATLTTTYNYTTDGSYTKVTAIKQPITITDSSGKVVRFRYDARGNNVRVTDTFENATELSFNLADLLEEERTPEITPGGVGYLRKVYTYGYLGGPQIHTYLYDEQGILAKQENTIYGVEGELLGQSGDTDIVSYTYDALYRRVSLTDGRNQTTLYRYNSVGNLTQIQYPGGGIQYSSYDIEGRLIERIDGNSVHIQYEYNDSEGLLTKIHYPSSPTMDIQYNYDNYGRKTQMTDPTGVTTYNFGSCNGMIISVTTQYTGLTPKTISYNYYPDGSRKSMTIPTATGTGMFVYEYNKSSQMISSKNPFGKITSWLYDSNGRLIRQTLGNRSWTSYNYDVIGRKTRVIHYSPKGKVLSDFSDIRYNAKANLTQFQMTTPGLPIFNGVTTYTYDNKDQLLNESSTRLNGYTRDYAFDAAGNLTIFAGSNHSNYNVNNQLMETGYNYDGNGNPTLYMGNHLTFDFQNHLTEFRDANNALLMSAGYNGKGLRIWKEGYNGREYFLYDGKKLIAEFNAAGNVTTIMTWGDDSIGLLARNDIWYQYDLHRNLLHRLNAKGNIVSTNLYDAWGNRLVGEENDGPYGYNAQFGYYTDRETGLILCTHRYYDPTHGTWITRDPISYDGGANLYTYCYNSPVNLMDQNGQFVPVLLIFRWGMLSGTTAIGLMQISNGIDCRIEARKEDDWMFNWFKKIDDCNADDNMRVWRDENKIFQPCNQMLREGFAKLVTAGIFAAVIKSIYLGSAGKEALEAVKAIGL
jgi:RHS repeat-associated protein